MTAERLGHDFGQVPFGVGQVAARARWNRLITTGELGFVYFVDDGLGAIKIGWSTNPAKRFASLQTGSSRELKMIGYLPVDGEGLSEQCIHALFEHLRIRGEWFKLAPELALWLEGAEEYAIWHRGAARRRAFRRQLPPAVPA